MQRFLKTWAVLPEQFKINNTLLIRSSRVVHGKNPLIMSGSSYTWPLLRLPAGGADNAVLQEVLCNYINADFQAESQRHLFNTSYVVRMSNFRIAYHYTSEKHTLFRRRDSFKNPYHQQKPPSAADCFCDIGEEVKSRSIETSWGAEGDADQGAEKSGEVGWWLLSGLDISNVRRNPPIVRHMIVVPASCSLAQALHL